MDLEAHLQGLERDGFTIVPAAIPSHLLAPMRLAFERICAAVRQTRAPEFWSNETNDAGVVDFFRAYELDPSFEPLMDLGAVFPILDAALRQGRDGRSGVPRLRTPVTQFLPGNTPSTNSWHRDGGHIRLTYILDDLEGDGGGTAVVAGSHTDRLLNKEANLPLPQWFQDNPLASPQDAREQTPHRILVPLEGMPAGSCMINWTDIVHRRTDNRSSSSRRTFWQVYNTGSWQHGSLGDRLCAHLSREYRASQTDPVRIGLMDDSLQRGRGSGFWRLEDLDESHPTWPYRMDDVFDALAAQGGRGWKAAL